MSAQCQPQTGVAQSERDYLASLNADRLQGCTVSADYWSERDHSSDAKPVATVKPDARLQPCTVKPLRVNEAPTLFESTYAARVRRAFMDAQSVRREAVKPALRALTAFLSPSETPFVLTDHPTYGAALEALYARYRQSARELASLMQRAPHDGRPPMAVRVPSTVGAMQVRYSDRWQSTPHTVQACYSLHTVPMQRSERVAVSDEWRAAIDRGCTVTEFAASASDRRKRSRSGKVAPTVKRRKLTAADLPPVLAD